MSEASRDNPKAHGVAADQTQRARSRKYMVFHLEEERFAVPLSQVKEVIVLANITPVPDMPSYFKGLINLRGRIISVIDLRTKLSGGRSAKASARKPCIIISEIEGITIGSIVDDVSEVAGIDDTKIERNLNISNPATKEYISGAARFDDAPLTLLIDLARVLNVDEFKRISAAASAA